MSGSTTNGEEGFEVGDNSTVPPTTTANPESLDDGACGEVTVNLEPETPTLVLLVDQSGSMEGDFGGVERWAAVYDTLMDPNDGVLANLEGTIRFGLTLYSSMDGNAGGECPLLTTVDPALNNYAAIDTAYAPERPIDETPTGESLEAAAMALAAFNEPGPKGIVLATDGAPDTCAEPNPQNGQAQALAAAQLAFGMDIRTFIISVGADVDAPHQQEMANVGIGRAPDDPNAAPVYEALSPAELVAAFRDIVGEFISCELTIDGEVDLDQACEGTVTLDGDVLECGVDWEVTDPSTLLILGQACETLKDGQQHTVSARWPCGAVFIP